MPETMPEREPMDATDGVLLVHTPPGVVLASEMVLPTQTVDDPDMVPAEG